MALPEAYKSFQTTYTLIHASVFNGLPKRMLSLMFNFFFISLGLNLFILLRDIPMLTLLWWPFSRYSIASLHCSFYFLKLFIFFTHLAGGCWLHPFLIVSFHRPMDGSSRPLSSNPIRIFCLSSKALVW